MQPSKKDFIAEQYMLSPNKVIPMAATCGHTVMVHTARQLGVTYIQKAMNIAANGDHTHTS